jgi:hypothetical protein
VGVEGRISLGTSDDDRRGEMLEGWKKLEASHVSYNTMNAGLSSPQDHIEAITEFKKLADSAV